MRQLAGLILALFVMTGLCTVAGAQEEMQSSMQQNNPMIHRAGTHIVDGNGNEIKLRSVNLGGWLIWEGWIFGKGILTENAVLMSRLDKSVGVPDTVAFRNQIFDHFITEDDIAEIARLGFNCVRIPLNYSLFDQETGWRVLDRVLGWCERHRVYAVLDLHNVPGSSIGGKGPRQIWQSKETQAKISNVWRAIAARYAHSAVVAGYDLINEPLPPRRGMLVPVCEQLVADIRQVDPQHMIIIEGGKFATDFSMFKGLLDSNQAFSFHMYTWFGDNRRKKLPEYAALAARTNAPLWCGEFGENNYDVIASTVRMYETYPEIGGWSYWTWKKAPNRFPGLVTINMPPTWATVMNWLGDLFGRGRGPAPNTIREGMGEFVQAVNLGNCKLDERMVQALLSR